MTQEVEGGVIGPSIMAEDNATSPLVIQKVKEADQSHDLLCFVCGGVGAFTFQYTTQDKTYLIYLESCIRCK